VQPHIKSKLAELFRDQPKEPNWLWLRVAAMLAGWALIGWVWWMLLRH
jgi:hypothetical protein